MSRDNRGLKLYPFFRNCQDLVALLSPLQPLRAGPGGIEHCMTVSDLTNQIMIPESGMVGAASKQRLQASLPFFLPQATLSSLCSLTLFSPGSTWEPVHRLQWERRYPWLLLILKFYIPVSLSLPALHFPATPFAQFLLQNVLHRFAKCFELAPHCPLKC